MLSRVAKQGQVASGRGNDETPGWMQRHGTDRAIVVAKDNFDRSQNRALDQGVQSNQHYGKQLGKSSIIVEKRRTKRQ